MGLLCSDSDEQLSEKRRNAAFRASKLEGVEPRAFGLRIANRVVQLPVIRVFWGTTLT
jgi:hypothetical protein